MPIKRKLLPIGGSKGITLPKSWIDFIEQKYGEKIVEVAIEVDQKLIVTPIIKEKLENETKD